jgi:hypothetical protein
MDCSYVWTNFDKKWFLDRQGHVSKDERFPDKNYWGEYGVEMAAVVSEKMLVNQVLDRKVQNENGPVEHVCVYLCYNWKLKTEFVLVSIAVHTTRSGYSPQYGRDSNYNERTQTDTKYLAFSTEAFKREKPDLAVCLDSI